MDIIAMSFVFPIPRVPGVADRNALKDSCQDKADPVAYGKDHHDVDIDSEALFAEDTQDQ
jgi:hypothetical protein